MASKASILLSQLVRIQIAYGAQKQNYCCCDLDLPSGHMPILQDMEGTYCFVGELDGGYKVLKNADGYELRLWNNAPQQLMYRFGRNGSQLQWYLVLENNSITVFGNSTLPASNFLIVGAAGSRDANGLYKRDGNAYARYKQENGEFTVWKRNGRWLVTKDYGATEIYYAVQSSIEPPVTGWIAASADKESPPTVEYDAALCSPTAPDGFCSSGICIQGYCQQPPTPPPAACDCTCYEEEYSPRDISSRGGDVHQCECNSWHGERLGCAFASRECCEAHTCDWRCYLDRYPDVSSLYGVTNTSCAEDHYLKIGRNENRNCSCLACADEIHKSSCINRCPGYAWEDGACKACASFTSSGTCPLEQCVWTGSMCQASCSIMAYKNSSSETCGPYNSSSWTNTCRRISLITVPPGCIIEVANKAKGTTWGPFSSNVLAEHAIGYDIIRFIRVYQINCTTLNDCLSAGLFGYGCHNELCKVLPCASYTSAGECPGGCVWMDSTCQFADLVSLELGKGAMQCYRMLSQSYKVDMTENVQVDGQTMVDRGTWFQTISVPGWSEGERRLAESAESNHEKESVEFAREAPEGPETLDQSSHQPTQTKDGPSVDTALAPAKGQQSDPKPLPAPSTPPTFSPNGGAIPSPALGATNGEGASSHLICPPRSFEPCGVGRWSPLGYSFDRNIIDKQLISEFDLSACLNCPKGQYSNESTSIVCTHCGFGEFTSDGGRSACESCSLGSQLLSSSSRCDECKPGEYGAIDPKTSIPMCQECQRGQYSNNNGTTACKTCLAGQVAATRDDGGDDGGYVQCVDCRAGTYRTPEELECRNCDPGRFSNVTRSSFCAGVCPIGTMSINSDTSYSGRVCAPCATGMFTNLSEQALCTLCRPGKFAEKIGVSACTSCSPGKAPSAAIHALYLSVPMVTSMANEQLASIDHESYSTRFGNESEACTDCSRGKFSFKFAVTECRDCQAGHYGSKTGRTGCKSCPPFETSPAGQNSVRACDCDTGNWKGLSTRLNGCGCLDEYFLSLTDKGCFPCSRGEACNWEGNASYSRTIPKVLPGFWAFGVSDASMFSKNIVHRCLSSRQCLGDDRCVEGRRGIACGECLPRWYGGSVICLPCNGPPSMYAWRMSLMVLFLSLCMYCITLAFSLSGVASKTKNLRTIRVSARQLFKFAALTGVISMFSVRFPDPVAQLLACFRFLQMDVAVPVACLFDEETEGLTLGWKWSFPVFIVFLECLMKVFSHLVSRILASSSREWIRKRAKSARISWTQAFSVLYQLWTVYFAMLMQTSLQWLTCLESPHGRRTVGTFPHIECFSTRWWRIFPAAIASLLVNTVAYVAATAWMVQQVAAHMRSCRRMNVPITRGTWFLASEDYRDTHIHWPLYVICKDTCVNVIGAALAEFPTAQLLGSAFVMALYFWFAHSESPFKDESNNILEMGISGALLIMLLMTAGLGFGMDVEKLFKAGVEDPNYRVRSFALLGIYVASIALPACVMTTQLLLLHPRLALLVPRRLRPIPQEKRRRRLCQLSEDTKNFSRLQEILEEMDDVEWLRFESSVALSGSAIKRIRPQSETFVRSWTLGAALTGRFRPSLQPRHSSRTSAASNGTVNCFESSNSCHQRPTSVSSTPKNSVLELPPSFEVSNNMPNSRYGSTLSVAVQPPSARSTFSMYTTVLPHEDENQQIEKIHATEPAPAFNADKNAGLKVSPDYLIQQLEEAATIKAEIDEDFPVPGQAYGDCTMIKTMT